MYIYVYDKIRNLNKNGDSPKKMGKNEEFPPEPIRILTQAGPARHLCAYIYIYIYVCMYIYVYDKTGNLNENGDSPKKLGKTANSRKNEIPNKKIRIYIYIYTYVCICTWVGIVLLLTRS